MAKSKISYSAKLNLELKGLDKLKKLQNKIKNTPNMGEGVKKEFDQAGNNFNNTMKKVERRIKSGNFKFSDLGIEDQIKKLEKITNKRIGTIKGGITKKDTDVSAQQKTIKKLKDQYKNLDDTIEKARIEVTKFENEGQKLKKRFNIDTTDIETINRKIKEQHKLIANEPKSSKAKQSAIKEAARLKKAREAAKGYNQELGKKNAIVDGYISKRDEVFQSYKKEQQIKDKMNQEKMKDIDDPAINSAEQMKGKLRNIKLGGTEIEQEKEKKAAKAKTAKTTKQLETAEKSHNDTINDKIVSGVKYYVVLNQLKKLYSSLTKIVSEFDKAMTTVAMVSSMNRDEVWDLSEAYKELGDQVGMAATEVAELSIYFFRQGRSAQDALEMTRVAAESARVASIDATESANYLTSAINGFELAASDAENVADRFAKLGAASASSYDELARAMSKVAPSAKSSGVDIDHMMGFLAKGIETTREAPQNIGTAFKTIFARMQELSDFSKTLEDGVNVNRVEKALGTVGVELRNTMGIFRPAQEIIMDLGEKWDGLDRNMQSYLATIMAGIRQQPRLLALMNNFTRTQELVTKSQSAAGEMAIQHASYLGGLEGSVQRLTNAWTGFIDSISSSEQIITFIDLLRKGLNGLTSVIQWFGEGGTVMVTAITAMTVAIVLSQVQLIKNTFSTIKNILAKQKQLMIERKLIVVNKIKARQMKSRLLYLNKESTALSNNLKLRRTTSKAASLQYKSIIVGSKGAAFATRMLTMATKGLVKAFLPLLALTVALKAVSWVWEKIAPIVGKVIDYFKDATQTTEELGKSIGELQVQIHNLDKEKEQVSDLVEEFDTLNSKVSLTQDEMKKLDVILSNLSKAELGDYQDFTETTASGRITFDREKYEEALESVNEEKQGLEQDQIDKYNVAIETHGISEAMQNSEIEIIHKRILFRDMAIEFENLDDKVKTQLTNQLDKAITDMDFATYFKKTPLEIPISATNINALSQKGQEAFGNNVDLPLDRIRDIMEDKGYTTGIETDKQLTDAYYNAVSSFQITDEDVMRSYEEELKKSLPEALKEQYEVQSSEYDEAINAIDGTATKEEEIAAEINSISAGREAAAKIIEESSASEVIKDMAEIALDNANLEAVAIKKLKDKYQMDIEAIVSWKTDGVGYNKMQNLFDKVENNIEISPQDSSEHFQDRSAIMGSDYFDFSGSSRIGPVIPGMEEVDGLMEKFTSAKTNLERLNIIDELDLKNTGEIISELFGITHKGIEEISRGMDQASEEAHRLQDLHESFSKGDASAEDLGQFVLEYGQDGINALETGEGLNDLIIERNRLRKIELGNNVEEYKLALKNSDLSDEEEASMERTLLWQEFLLANYKDITKLDMQRANSLKDINGYLEDAENMHNRASSLRDMGLEEVAELFDSMGDKTLGLGFESSKELIKQDIESLTTLDGELANMDGAVKEDGIWKYNGDDEDVDDKVKEYNSKVDEAEGSIDKYIELYEYEEEQLEDQLKETNKAIEEQYSERIDTIKEAHDQRWNDIEYESDLKESNQDILNIRRRISALSRQDSRASKAKLQEEEKTMKDAQKERQKMIEKEIMEQEIKIQEDAQEEKLRQAEVKNTEAMNNLTGSVDGLAGAIDRFIGSITSGSGETDGPDGGANTNTDSGTDNGWWTSFHFPWSQE